MSLTKYLSTKKYLIPELTSIVLDYYYSAIHKENTIKLVAGYQKLHRWKDYMSCLSISMILRLLADVETANIMS